ncbi:unnamed protein product [Brassica rapa subsp. narinosa]
MKTLDNPIQVQGQVRHTWTGSSVRIKDLVTVSMFEKKD